MDATQYALWTKKVQETRRGNQAWENRVRAYKAIAEYSDSLTISIEHFCRESGYASSTFYNYFKNGFAKSILSDVTEISFTTEDIAIIEAKAYSLHQFLIGVIDESNSLKASTENIIISLGMAVSEWALCYPDLAIVDINKYRTPLIIETISSFIPSPLSKKDKKILLDLINEIVISSFSRSINIPHYGFATTDFNEWASQFRQGITAEQLATNAITGFLVDFLDGSATSEEAENVLAYCKQAIDTILLYRK